MMEQRVIGLMSGTSLDGIDAAVVRTDGQRVLSREGFLTLPYDEDLRGALRAALNTPPGGRAGLARLERRLTERHAEAVRVLLNETGMTASDIDLVGFHGQTISHDPAAGYTLQLGDGALLAEMTGIDVVFDFRTRDVASGGQGAPLVPVYHQALAAALEKPVCFLNIGGVANLTYIGLEAADVVAFDTGPGNALIDDWCLAETGAPFDDGGVLCGRGRVDGDVLKKLMENDFFDSPPPKSLDRNGFSATPCAGLSAADGAATLVALTVQAVVRAQAHLPDRPRRWIVCGGGRLNAALMRGLALSLSVPVEPVEVLGLNGDAIEAEAFALLAVRHLYGLPQTFPGTTGVAAPLTGGRMARAAQREKPGLGEKVAGA